MNEKNFNYQVEQLGNRISEINKQIERLSQTASDLSIRQQIINMMDQFTTPSIAQYIDNENTYKKFIVTPLNAQLVDQLNTQADLYRHCINNQSAAEGFCLFITD